jgi:hypothetical protein
MTRKGVLAPPVSKPIELGHLKLSALKYRFNLEKLRNVIAEFGSLPEDGQHALFNHLLIARLSFENQKIIKTSPSKIRTRLEAIERFSEGLLRSLGYNPNDPKAPPWEPRDDLSEREQLWIYLNMQLVAREATGCIMRSSLRTLGRSRDAIGADIRAFDDRLADLVLGLWWLTGQVPAAIKYMTPDKPIGHGGSRRTVSLKGQLTRDVIEIYTQLKLRYGTGKRPGYGGPLRRFVQAVGDLFDATIEDKAIASAWRSLHSRNSKPK